MSVGVLGSRIAAPPADASRVAAIRNKLNLNNAAEVAAFGERAAKDLLSGVERFLTEVRNNPVADVSARLRAAQARIDTLDPSELEPRGGLDNLFNGRNARLHRFRRAFEGVAAELGGLSADLDARAQKMERQSTALNGLHEQARVLILELDAYLDAGRARLAEARAAAPAPEPVAEGAPAEPTAADRLAARLEDLNRTRHAALQQLPLARVVQNADAFLADDLGGAKAAFGDWRAAWAELLGVGRDADKHRPNIPALAEAKVKANGAIARVLASLADHSARRADGEVRMKTAAAGALKS